MIPIERSAGAVVFLKKEDNFYYLLLHYKAGHWGLPKGHIEKEESLKETVAREVEEETGIDDLKFISDFQEKTEYFFQREGKRVFKTNKIFLAQTKKEEIDLSHEHVDFVWLSYHKALEKTTFKSTKEIIKKAQKFLKSEF